MKIVFILSKNRRSNESRFELCEIICPPDAEDAAVSCAHNLLSSWGSSTNSRLASVNLTASSSIPCAWRSPPACWRCRIRPRESEAQDCSEPSERRHSLSSPCKKSVERRTEFDEKSQGSRRFLVKKLIGIKECSPNVTSNRECRIKNIRSIPAPSRPSWRRRMVGPVAYA